MAVRCPSNGNWQVRTSRSATSPANSARKACISYTAADLEAAHILGTLARLPAECSALPLVAYALAQAGGARTAGSYYVAAYVSRLLLVCSEQQRALLADALAQGIARGPATPSLFFRALVLQLRPARPAGI